MTLLAPRRRPQAPRDRPAVIVAELDLGARRDWLTLFPVLTTRRPAAYTAVTRTEPPPQLPRWLGGCAGSGPESPRPGGSGSFFYGLPPPPGAFAATATNLALAAAIAEKVATASSTATAAAADAHEAALAAAASATAAAASAAPALGIVATASSTARSSPPPAPPHTTRPHRSGLMLGFLKRLALQR